MFDSRIVLVFLLINHGVFTSVSATGLFGFELPNLFGMGSEERAEKKDKLDPIDYFLLDIVPRFMGSQPNNENGTKFFFEKYAMEDDSNDDAAKMTGVSGNFRKDFDFS